MPPECPEVALAGAARGDEAAIATLYRSFNPVLLRYLRHHVGRVAEDVASDVWLLLAPQLAGFEGGVSRFRALMFTIARRRVIDEYRRNGRQTPTVSFDEEYAEAFDQADSNDTEAEAISRLTAQSAVEALVRGLPEDQAEIVLLRVLGDLDVEQVAGIVGKSKGAVRIAQHRALQRLQETWSKKAVTR
jgi:RNA polymerase sigma-70 factor (ECF subfamily)